MAPQSSGVVLELQYKAYVYVDGKISWSLKQVLEMLMKDRAGRIDVCKEIRRQGVDWQVFFMRLQSPWDEVLQRSMRSVASTDGAVSDLTRQEATVATAPLLALHVFWAATKRKVSDRTRSLAMLTAFLLRLTDMRTLPRVGVHQALRQAGPECDGGS